MRRMLAAEGFHWSGHGRGGANVSLGCWSMMVQACHLLVPRLVGYRARAAYIYLFFV